MRTDFGPDFASLHAAARRERTLAMNRLVFAPIAAFFRQIHRDATQPMPRKPAAAFRTARGW